MHWRSKFWHKKARREREKECLKSFSNPLNLLALIHNADLWSRMHFWSVKEILSWSFMSLRLILDPVSGNPPRSPQKHKNAMCKVADCWVSFPVCQILSLWVSGGRDLPTQSVRTKHFLLAIRPMPSTTATPISRDISSGLPQKSLLNSLAEGQCNGCSCNIRNCHLSVCSLKLSPKAANYICHLLVS